MYKWIVALGIILTGAVGLIFWDANRPVLMPTENYYPTKVVNNSPRAATNITGQEISSAPLVAEQESLLDNQKTQDHPVQVVEHAIKVLSVPFTVQAPYANWDLPYQEACEEASIIMLVDFVLGRKDLRLSADEADQRILELVSWETENDYSIDITAQEVSQVLKDRFAVNAEVVSYSLEEIKKQINLGHPIILPAAGRLLGNPYFRSPGPLYHMVVVKGYEGDELITNDPGTKRGEGFRYHYSTLDKAVHDWNGGDVQKGEQVMVIIN